MDRGTPSYSTAIAILARTALLDTELELEPTWKRQMEQKNPCSAMLSFIGAIKNNTVEIIHPQGTYPDITWSTEYMHVKMSYLQRMIQRTQNKYRQEN